MGMCKKKALLDADFVIKTVISTNSEENHLIDLLMAQKEFDFICHSKTLEEVSVHDQCGASKWLKDKINAGLIKEYSDADILKELSGVYGSSAIGKYLDYLKSSCNAYKSGYYENHFNSADEMYSSEDTDAFLAEIEKCDLAIGRGQSLGEKKSLVLLQMLMDLFPGDVYQFCSDDRGARSGVVSITEGVKCVSVLTVFHHLHKLGITKSVVEEYYTSYSSFLGEAGQTAFRVMDISNSFIAVDFSKVLDDVYNDKFASNDLGYLKYKA